VTFVGLREQEEVVAWSDVQVRARRVAAALRRLGIQRGDRVALVLRTEPAFLDLFFGATLAGAVPVPLYPPVRLGRMDEYCAATARMLEVSGARLVVAGEGIRRLLGKVEARAAPELGIRGAEELVQERAELEEPLAPEDLALVQFSSGSTVDPKPVALTQANIAAQCAALIQLVNPSPLDRLLSWLPLYHDMGLIGCLLTSLSRPGPLVLISPEHFLARPALWLRAVARHRATISAAPSFAYGYAARRIADADLAGLDLSCWRIALDGAEPISSDAVRRFGQRFARFGFDVQAITPCYGLSEATLAVTCAPIGRPLRSCRIDPERLGAAGLVSEGGREVVSVGPPIPGVELELRGEDGRPLPEGRVGRIHVRGPSVARRCLDGTDPLRGGWLDTGDLGFARDGELYVHGRSKDLVMVRGANRAPEEFESCLDAIPGVRAGCAVALGFSPPGGDGEELLLLVERARPGAGAVEPALEERVTATVLERTGVRPHTVRILAPGTLPRTSSGKLRRSEALRRFLAGALEPPRRVTPLGLALEVARSAWARHRAAAGRGSQLASPLPIPKP